MDDRSGFGHLLTEDGRPIRNTRKQEAAGDRNHRWWITSCYGLDASVQYYWSGADDWKIGG